MLSAAIITRLAIGSKIDDVHENLAYCKKRIERYEQLLMEHNVRSVPVHSIDGKRSYMADLK